MTAAAWHPDPTGRHELRYWDGAQWTDHVSDRGVQSTSPLYPPADEQQAHQAQPSQEAQEAQDQDVQPSADADSWVGSSVVDAQAEAAGTSDAGDAGDASASGDASTSGTAAPDAVTAFAPMSSPSGGAPAQAPSATPPSWEPQPYQPQSYEPQPAAAAPVMGNAGSPGSMGHVGQLGDAFAGISGELIDGRFSEVDGAGAMLQNRKLLRVRITEPFMAKQGSMVAYQGNVDFAYQGGGAAKFLKKALTGEGLSLMRVEGQGDVFLADLAHDVHILHLQNSGLSVNGRNVLAFSASLDWNVERVKGGSIAAGGLFNTTLRGTGWVAITTEGMPVVLNAAEAPTFADANALVAWSVHLQTSIRSTVSAGALIGRGSGEAFQVSFQGPGFVIVQPSEGPPVTTTG